MKTAWQHEGPHAMGEMGNVDERVNMIQAWRIGRPTPLRSVAEIAVVIAASTIFFFAIFSLPDYGDWNYYYEVSNRLGDPYSIPFFLNPVWTAWLLAPFSLLPKHLAGAIWVTLSVLTMIWCAWRFGGRPSALLLCLLSPPFFRFITAGQVDALPLLGFTLLQTASSWRYRGIGLILMTIKPQVLCLGALAHWLKLERRQKTLLLLPVIFVLAASFVIHGFWPQEINLRNVGGRGLDFSPWPYGIPIGLLLLRHALSHNRAEIGALATYFLVPYIAPYSLLAYAVVLFSVAPLWISTLSFALMWIFSFAVT